MTGPLGVFSLPHCLCKVWLCHPVFTSWIPTFLCSLWISSGYYDVFKWAKNTSDSSSFLQLCHQLSGMWSILANSWQQVTCLCWGRVLFVENKDKTFWPCTDFHVCSISVKNREPLPTLSPAFELLHGLTVSTKLDLQDCRSLSCVGGGKWKTAFDTLSGIYE